MASRTTRGVKLSGKITYIRSRVPSVRVPPYTGRRYEVMAPARWISRNAVPWP